MAPPSFADLGKDSRDLFSKGFHNGIVKLDVKTLSANKLELKLSGTHAQASSKTEGSLEGKLNVKDYGLSITESWDTKNVLGAKFELEPQVVKGLKLTLDTHFNATTGGKDGSLKAAYKHPFANVQLSSGLQLGPPVLNAAGVFGYQGWLAGGQVTFDAGKQAVTKTNLALGYSASDLQLLTAIKDLNDFSGSVYHKVSKDTEIGIELGWTSGTAASAARFGFAAKHKLDGSSHVNVAIDNKANVKLGYTNVLKPGVKATFSSAIDGKAISGGDHKVGLGLDFDLS